MLGFEVKKHSCIPAPHPVNHTPMTYGIDKPVYEKLNKTFHDQWGVSLRVATPGGDIVMGQPDCLSSCTARCSRAIAHVIAESLRWGEPAVYDWPGGFVFWAVPLMYNAELLGGLVACAPEKMVFPEEEDGLGMDLKAACESLLDLAAEANVTNGVLLAVRRERHQREQKRAEAIHAMKSRPSKNMLEAYLREEPELLSAIRQGDRPEAVSILNRVLTAIYFNAGDNFDLIKSFVMELVVTMCRTAVEGGGAPQELLGTNYANLVDLGRMESEEELTPWLGQMLKRMMDAIEKQDAPSAISQVNRGVEYIHQNYAEPITRDMAARAADMSPTKFSKSLKAQTGKGFTDLLNQVRMDNAARMLRHTDMGLFQIALEVGFNDQSYFTKVFRRHLGCTPKEYRKANVKED